MFEDSLMESGGQIKTKSGRWMIATTAFYGLAVAILILIPLINLVDFAAVVDDGADYGSPAPSPAPSTTTSTADR